MKRMSKPRLVANKDCNKGLDTINSKVTLNELREAVFEGRNYLVAPVVMMVEGVHSGSGGPMYYSAEILSEMAAGWNGQPVPVFHPEDGNGNPTSCNDPSILEQRNAGRIFNVHFENGKLIGEVWLDINRTEQIYPGLLADIRNGEQVEVSTGMFPEFDDTPGEWNGENYVGSVVNLRPDHLALLPGSRGACSWADGCGIRAHELVANADEKTKPFLEKFALHLESELKLYVNEIGYRDVLRQLQRQADALDGPEMINGMHFIEEVYDGYFIMRREGPNNAPRKFFKMNYSIDESQIVRFDGEAQEVMERREYVPINSNESTQEEKMEKKQTNNEEKKPCCDELIQSLIDNEHTVWTENDRGMLDELPQDVLEKMVPVVNKEETPAPKEPANVDEYIQNAPEDFRPVLKHAMQTHKARVDGLVKAILENKMNTFTETQLRAKDLDELVALAKLAQVKVNQDYSVAPVVHEDAAETGESPLELPIVNYGK